MEKNERTRTMVYSNVNKNKKADKKSASKKSNIIDLDDEIVIGLAKFPEPDTGKSKKSNKKSKKEESKKNDIKNAIKKSKEDKKNNEIEFIGDKTVKNKETSHPKINKEKQNTKAQNIQSKIKKQKIKAIRRMTVFLFFILLLIGGLVYFLLSPVFNIKKIEVINNVNISKEQIINSSGIVLNENMFKMSVREAEEKISQNPYVESVDVDRKIFDKIEINVKERTATLMLEYGNSYVFINNQGYILEITTAKLEAPILTGYVTPLEQVKPGNRLNKDDLERLTTVLNIMESAETNNFANLITKIDISSKKNYKLTIESEDKIVHLGECLDLSTQMLFVKEMLQREKGIEGDFFVNMDLNEGNPVFREKV